MYRKSTVQSEKLFSSAGNIVNKMRSSLDANTVNMPVCLSSWLSVNIWVKKRLWYFLLLTEF